MKKAFTLLELLVVVAIMAMLGVASSGGYNALVRGMKERGAVASASALLRSAKERALIDRVPTVVFCYNRMLREAGGAEDANAVVVGEMVAVRRFGRISGVSDRLLFDEFGNLDDFSFEKVEDTSDLQDSGGMRLYRFGGGTMSDMRYSLVSEMIYRKDESVPAFTFAHGYTNMAVCAFYNLKKSDREPDDDWKVGDAYGFEFAELQLPGGFIFGSEIPTQPGKITTPKVMYFDPEKKDAKPSIDMWTTKPGSGGKPVRFRRAGEVKADEKSAV